MQKVKIIFSRKGFDSSAGGCPSLIFPDGSLFSIPIPSSKDDFFYSDLEFFYEGNSIQSILNDITGEKITNGSTYQCDYSLKSQRCHYDPMPIQNGVQIVFGQAGGSESHLRKQHIEKGDIFLFYGWFKQVEKNKDSWQYKAGAKDIHLVWGWMSIGEMINLDDLPQREMVHDQYPNLAGHPHLAPWRNSPNRIYLSGDSGLLSYSGKACLSDCERYQGRSTWVLPICFNHPEAFTYLKRFSPCGDQVTIQIPGRGQEFVLDLEKFESSSDIAGVIDWVNELIQSNF